MFSRNHYYKPELSLPSLDDQFLAHYFRCQVLWIFTSMCLTLEISRCNFTNHYFLACQSHQGLSQFFLSFLVLTISETLPIANFLLVPPGKGTRLQRDMKVGTGGRFKKRKKKFGEVTWWNCSSGYFERSLYIQQTVQAPICEPQK